MISDTVIKGKDNPVIMNFAFPSSTIGTEPANEFETLGLDSFDEITVDIQNESYSTINTPENLFLNGNYQLRLKIGSITNLSLGTYNPEVIGISAEYPNGYLLSGAQTTALGPIFVV